MLGLGLGCWHTLWRHASMCCRPIGDVPEAMKSGAFKSGVIVDILPAIKNPSSEGFDTNVRS